jgi:hypothetical protein
VALFVPSGATGRAPTVIFPTFGPTPGGTPLPTLVRPPERGKGLDALTDGDWAALLDFSDQQLLGKTVSRRFDQFPETPR